MSQLDKWTNKLPKKGIKSALFLFSIKYFFGDIRNAEAIKNKLKVKTHAEIYEKG